MLGKKYYLIKKSGIKRLTLGVFTYYVNKTLHVRFYLLEKEKEGQYKCV